MSTPTVQLTSPVLTLNGTEAGTPWLSRLLGIRIQRGVSAVGRAVLRFDDHGYALSTQAAKLGMTVKIGVVGGGTLFEGVVTGLGLEHAGEAPPELVMTVDDAAHALGIVVREVTYENSSYRDVVTKLASRGRLSSDKIDFGNMSSTVHPYLLQRGSDLQYLDAMCRRSGCVWWVDGIKLNVAPARKTEGQVEVDRLEDLVEFSVRASGLRPTTVQVQGWDNAKKEFVGATDATPSATLAESTFVNDFVGRAPKKGLPATSAKEASRFGSPSQQTEAAALANALVTEWESAAVTARGLVWVRADLKPRMTVKVVNAGPSSGKYTVTEVEHLWRRDGFFTRFVAGPVRPSGLVDTLGAEPGPTGLEMTGLTTGLVTEVRHRDAANKGMVRVRFSGSSDGVVSAWARVLTLGGGANRGAVFFPEVNDEVLIGFERGDGRHPVILGGLFNSKDAFAAGDDLTDASGAITYRRVTSRMGHVIELGDSDEPSKSHVLLRTKSGHQLRLGEDGFTLDVKNAEPMKITVGKASLEIDGQGNVTIKGIKIAIKGTEVAIEAETTAAVKGVSVSLEAKAEAELKGAMTTVQGQGPVKVKGTPVMIN